jgi:hypothetical protein
MKIAHGIASARIDEVPTERKTAPVAEKPAEASPNAAENVQLQAEMAARAKIYAAISEICKTLSVPAGLDQQLVPVLAESLIQMHGLGQLEKMADEIKPGAGDALGKAFGE